MLLAAAVLGSPASAQDANIRSVTFYTVKPDRIGDFQAEIKESTPSWPRPAPIATAPLGCAHRRTWVRPRPDVHKWGLDSTIDNAS